MQKRLTISIILAVISIFVAVAPVMAGPPLRVRIEAPTVIGSSPNPFTASGTAVTSGQICPAGEVHDLSNTSFGRPGGRFTILRVLKRFDCDDGSGSFKARLIVRLNNRTFRTRAAWRLVGGTGDYTDLRGNGRLLGIPIDPGISVLDIYTGQIH